VRPGRRPARLARGAGDALAACGIDGVVPEAAPPLDDRARAAGEAASRGALRLLVQAHRPRDACEAAARARILAELERLAHPFDRDADPVHVTASAVIAGARGTVLHLHRKLGRWLQPGGHLDEGESPAEAAARESREETGLVVAHPREGPTLLHLDVHPAGDHVHLDVRYLLLTADRRDPSPAPGESPHARWFSWQEAEAVADGPLVVALRAARAALADASEHGC